MPEDTDLPEEDAQEEETPEDADVEGKVSEEKEESADDFVPFGDDQEEKEEEPDEELDDEDRKVIDSRVKAHTSKLEDEVLSVKRSQEVSDFLDQSDNEVYRPVAAKIREYASNPRSRGMSIEAIARMAVDPRDLVSEGAKKEREATKESEEGMIAGASGREIEEQGKLPDAYGLSKEEFEKKASEAMRQ